MCLSLKEKGLAGAGFYLHLLSVLLLRFAAVSGTTLRLIVPITGTSPALILAVPASIFRHPASAFLYCDGLVKASRRGIEPHNLPLSHCVQPFHGFDHACIIGA